MINKKISTLAGASILLIIAGALSFSFLISDKQKEEMQTNSRSRDDEMATQNEGELIKSNANQKDVEANNSLIINGIYENVQYGYKINIPENFTIKKNGPTQDLDSLIRIFPKTDRTYLFSIYVSKSKFKNINSWLSDYEKKLSKINSYEGVEIKTPTIISREETIFGGLPAMKIVLNNMPFSNYLIVFIKNDLIYEFSYNGFLADQEELDVAGKQIENKNDLLQKYQLGHRHELDKMFDSFVFTK